MTRTLACALVALLLPTPAAGATLDDLRWSWRVILAWAEPGTDAEASFRRRVAELSCEIGARDVAVYRIHGDGAEPLTPDAPPLALSGQGPRTGAAGFEMVLIGKDGGVKARSTTPAELPDLLARIDRMPMRRREAAERGDPCA
jgi:hypothetical protein